jgi:hypothetical protein
VQAQSDKHMTLFGQTIIVPTHSRGSDRRIKPLRKLADVRISHTPVGTVSGLSHELAARIVYCTTTLK